MVYLCLPIKNSDFSSLLPLNSHIIYLLILIVHQDVAGEIFGNALISDGISSGMFGLM